MLTPLAALIFSVICIVVSAIIFKVTYKEIKNDPFAMVAMVFGSGGFLGMAILPWLCLFWNLHTK